MGVRATSVSEWDIGNFVFADEGALLGRAASVSGLETALDVAACRGGRDFPDILVEGMDADLRRWVEERAKDPGAKWDFLVRDNRRKRWVQLRGAFVVRLGSMSPYCAWAINGAEPADGPE